MRNKIIFTLLFIISLWILEGVDQLILKNTLNYGIQPHDTDTLGNIFVAPFLHANIQHLIDNTLLLTILTFLVTSWGWGRWALTTFIVILVGGLGTWLIGDVGTRHLGASILVFGYIGFLILGAILRLNLRNAFSGILAVGLCIYYPLMQAMLPNVAAGVSWEGHLFGFIGGLIGAVLVLK